ncbi:MAG: sensor histidine kinase [Betaproteobacteria bacterium]
MSLNRFIRLRSLKSRLGLLVLLPLVLLMSIDLVITFQNSSQIATLVQQQLLHGSAKMISQQLTFAEGSYEISVPPAAFELFKSKYRDRVFYSLHTKEGRLISGGEELPPYPNPLEIEEEKFFETTLLGEPVRVIAFAHSLTNSTSGDFAITQVAQTLRGHDEFRDSLLWSTIRAHLLLLSITTLALFIALHWTLNPLIEFGRTLLERQPGSLEKIEKAQAPTELEPVIEALNDYVSRLGSTLASYEKFVSDTAHHLRTSFAIITSQVDFGKRNNCQNQVQMEVLEAIQKALKHCTKVINQLLMLASVENTKQDQLIASEVQLSEIIVTVIEEMAALAQQKDIELGVDEFDESIQVLAPAKLLHEVFSNLVDNAIQHMGKPGTVIISLRRIGDIAEVCLTDNGIGIPGELRSKVFERFFQINKTSSNSSGLGLAIVKEICDVLNAKITLDLPDSGSGLLITIQFPMLQRAQ